MSDEPDDNGGTPTKEHREIAEEAEWSLGWLRRNLDDNRERTVKMLEEHYDRTIEQCEPIIDRTVELRKRFEAALGPESLVAVGLRSYEIKTLVDLAESLQSIIRISPEVLDGVLVMVEAVRKATAPPVSMGEAAGKEGERPS